MSEKPGGSDHPSGGETFEERLRAARARQGLDRPAPDPGQQSGGFGGSAVGIGLRVGLELVSALVVAVAIGYGLSLIFGARPIFLAVFVMLGGAAGVLNVWRLFAPGKDRWMRKQVDRGSGDDGGAASKH